MQIKELPVPLTSQMSEQAAEVLRVWVNADRNMDVTLISAFPQPSTWGILLVDIARHVARAYEADGACTQSEALSQIRELFDAEWDRPTDLGQTSELHEQ